MGWKKIAENIVLVVTWTLKNFKQFIFTAKKGREQWARFKNHSVYYSRFYSKHFTPYTIIYTWRGVKTLVWTSRLILYYYYYYIREIVTLTSDPRLPHQSSSKNCTRLKQRITREQLVRDFFALHFNACARARTMDAKETTTTTVLLPQHYTRLCVLSCSYVFREDNALRVSRNPRNWVEPLHNTPLGVRYNTRLYPYRGSGFLVALL